VIGPAIDELGHEPARPSEVIRLGEQLHGAADGGRIASDRGTVHVQHPVEPPELRDRVIAVPGEVPDVGVFGNDPQRSPLALAADQDRGMWHLDRLWLRVDTRSW
jgi:hypothetical protein